MRARLESAYRIDPHGGGEGKVRIVAALMVLVPASFTAAWASVEQRCGWILNPSPANWSLADQDGEWEIGLQGGYQAPGLDTIPDLTGANWIVTNGSTYGYGCICMLGDFDKISKKINRIEGVKQQALSICKSDKSLPPP